MKNVIKNIIANIGYIYFKKKYMPFGIDHAYDIYRFSEDEKDVQTIFDIGANIGQTAEKYFLQFPSAQIYCFEPVKKTFKQLKEKFSNEPRIHCFNIALGNQCGKASISVNSNSQLCTLKRSNDASMPLTAIEDIEITTLDNFVRDNKISKIDIIKTDTEGYDIEVLKGASNFIRHTPNCFIYSEVTFIKDDQIHTQFAEAYSFLDDFGFNFVGVYDHDYNAFKPAIPPSLYCNALFHKK